MNKEYGYWLGSVSYEHALDFQMECYKSYSKLQWLGFEVSTPTVTLGRSANAETEIESKHLFQKIIKTDRGGQATLHSPGQLVIFPVLDLRSFSQGARGLVCFLLRRIQNLCIDIASDEFEIRDQGVFSSCGKLGFVGLRIHEKRVFHGLSLNICNNIELFKGIKSCGAEGMMHDSLSYYCPQVTTEKAFFRFLDGDPSLLSHVRSDINQWNSKDFVRS